MSNSPDTPAQPPEDLSTDEWLAIAKRAQDLVGTVDLDRVTDHDDPEVQKLKRVVAALGDLSNGQDVSALDGADDLAANDDEPPPVIDERAARVARIMAELNAAGYAGRIGRIFVHAANDMQPREIVPHSEGLPSYDMVVAPDYAPAAGAHGIFISESGVFAAQVPEPVSEHRWRILRSRPFDDQSDLIATIEAFVRRNEA